MAVIIRIIMGFICAGMASNKGKSAGWGFVGGLLWGIFAIIYYACCASKK
jgi:hypothetical protein